MDDKKKGITESETKTMNLEKQGTIGCLIQAEQRNMRNQIVVIENELKQEEGIRYSLTNLHTKDDIQKTNVVASLEVCP